MTPVQPVRGTQSLLGEAADGLPTVVGAFDSVRRLYGFRRVEVPTIEQTSVFARTIGETTDVVSKEMYSFEDRGGESITLRPEFTAGICRAYLSEGWQQYAPLKVAAHGSAFRYERPQKGRFREFHQLDAEIIGAAEPQADVELLAFGYQLLQELASAQGTVTAGGRYDGLIESLGGPHTPAVGWAAGIERLAMMIDAPPAESPAVVIVPLGERAEAAAQGIVAGLRREGVVTDMAYRGNMKKRLSRANASGAAYALILGDDELDRGEAQLKDLATGEQRPVSLDLIADAIRQ